MSRCDRCALVDFTGSQILQQAVDELHRRNIDVAVARLEFERAKKAAARTGLIDVLGANRVFRSASSTSEVDSEVWAGAGSPI